jgi:integrase
MQDWRITRPDGPRPNYRILIDGMEIMLGTSIRVGECRGLRRCDVDMTTMPPTLVVIGTIVSTKAEGIHRKDTPKRSRQRRSIALPSVAAAAVRRRLALAEPDPDASLFPTKTGRTLSVSNYEGPITVGQETRSGQAARHRLTLQSEEIFAQWCDDCKHRADYVDE